MSNTNSYISASLKDTPPKLESHTGINNMVKAGTFKPIHIQVNPTNKCNLNCKFCSCNKVNRNNQLNIDHFKDFVNKHKDTIEAVTITGGGEPTLYDKLPEMVTFLHNNNIKIGMASNGIELSRWSKEQLLLLKQFKWIRLSISKDSIDWALHQPESTDKYTNLLDIIDLNYTDLALSYVIYDDYNSNIDKLLYIISLYKYTVLTHIRVVSDILHPDSELISRLESATRHIETNFPIIWQDRNPTTRGQQRCYLSDIKPVITAEGDIYSCCGAQYAINGKTGTYPEELYMGHITDPMIKQIDGSVCDVCYYDTYNTYIDNRVDRYNNLVHKEFI